MNTVTPVMSEAGNKLASELIDAEIIKDKDLGALGGCQSWEEWVAANLHNPKRRLDTLVFVRQD
jgi:hypothetical protein